MLNARIICLTIILSMSFPISNKELHSVELPIRPEKPVCIELEILDSYVPTLSANILNKLPSDIEYVAQCVEAEAGNQGYLGKVYVADCILNRYDRGGYETYSDVINAPGQFSVAKNGHINKQYTQETYDIVLQELENRTNNEIIYFKTRSYHSFATPCFQYKDHYFSK